ncbi:hypothetical protein ABKN59_005666 [Abortiporus biennis]
MAFGNLDYLVKSAFDAATFIGYPYIILNAMLAQIENNLRFDVLMRQQCTADTKMNIQAYTGFVNYLPN